MDPDFYTSLCYYTYFLAKNGQYDTFNILTKQYLDVAEKEDYRPTNNEFINFFQNCTQYFDRSLLEQPDKKIIVLKILLEMVGLFRIDKTNFARHNQHSIHFMGRIMPSMRENFKELFMTVTDTENTLFKRGLTTLLCIDLLQNTSTNDKRDKIFVLKQITDKKRAQAISHKLLRQLAQLEQIIIDDISCDWTDLFLLINPKLIDINQLKLTNSFQTLILCIIKISRQEHVNEVFESRISEFLEDQISNNRLQSKVP